MAKTRGGFRLGRRLLKVFRRCIVRRRTRRRYSVAAASESPAGPFSKLGRWVGSLMGLCSGSWKADPGYVQVGREDPGERPRLPKGHLAVYVGDGDDDACRVVVPVVYFNHPLFGELLREAEKVYGFNHPGGIQIPCRRSDFESVQMRIAAAGGGGGMWRRRWR